MEKSQNAEFISNSNKKENKNINIKDKILIKKTFNIFFQYIKQFEFPKDNISEENKNLINMFIEFIKIFVNLRLNRFGKIDLNPLHMDLDH